jgi:predicted PilT family ATPase
LIAKTTIAEQADADVEPESESTTMRLLAGNHKMGSVIGKGGSKIKEVQEASGARLTASEELLPNSTERVVSITGVPDAIHIAVYHIGLILEEKTERDRYGSANTVHYKPLSRDAYGAGGLTGGYGSSRSGGHGGYYHNSGAGGYGSHLHAGPMAPYPQEYVGSASGGPVAHTQAQQIFIPNDMVGSVIGKGGSKINEIRKASGSQISIADQPNKSGDERLVTITGTPESNQMAIYLLYSRLESEKDRQQN